MALITNPIPRPKTYAELNEIFETGTPVFGAPPAQFALPTPLLEWDPIADPMKAFTGGVARGLGGVSTFVGEALADVDVTPQQVVPGFFKQVGESLGASADYWRQQQTHAARQAQEFEWTGPGERSAFRAPGRKLALDVAGAFGTSAPTVAALAAGGGPGAAIIAGALEGAISEGATIQGLRNEIDAMSDEQLMSVPAFREARERGASEAEARRALKAAATDEVQYRVFGTTGALSALGAGVGGRFVRQQPSRFGRAWRGGVAEALPEGAQEVGEEFWAARAAQQTFDPGREPDYAEAFVGGAMPGAAMGFGGGLMSRGPAQPQQVPAAEQVAAEQRGPGVVPAQGLPGAVPGGLPGAQPGGIVGIPGAKPGGIGPPTRLPVRMPEFPVGRPPGQQPSALLTEQAQPATMPVRMPESPRTQMREETRLLPSPDGRMQPVTARQLYEDPQLRVQALYATNAPENVMQVTSPADVDVQVDFAMQRLPRVPTQMPGVPTTPRQPGAALAPRPTAEPVPVTPPRAVQRPVPRAAREGELGVRTVRPPELQQAQRIEGAQQRAEVLGQAPMTPEQRQIQRTLAALPTMPEETQVGVFPGAPERAEAVGMAREQLKTAAERRREARVLRRAEEPEVQAALSPEALAQARAQRRELVTGERVPRREITERAAAAGEQIPPRKIGLSERTRRRQRRLQAIRKREEFVREWAKPTAVQREARKEFEAAVADRVAAETLVKEAQGEVALAEEALEEAKTLAQALEQRLARMPAITGPKRQVRKQRAVRRELKAQLAAAQKAVRAPEQRLRAAEQERTQALGLVAQAREVEALGQAIVASIRAKQLAEREAAKKIAPEVPTEPKKIKGVEKVRTFEERLKAAAREVYRDEALMRRIGANPTFRKAFLDPTSPLRASGEFGDKVRRSLLAAMKAVAEKIDPKTDSADRDLMTWAMGQVEQSSRFRKDEALRDYGERGELQGALPSGLGLDLDEEITLIIERQATLGPAQLRTAVPTPSEEKLQTEQETMLNLAGIRREVGEGSADLIQDAKMLRGFLHALPLLERERPGAINFFETMFGSLFKMIPHKPVAQPKTVFGKRKVLGKEVVDITGEVKPAVPIEGKARKTYKTSVEKLDLALGFVDRWTADVRKKAKPVELTKQRVELHGMERKIKRRLVEEMDSIAAQAQAAGEPIQRQIDAAQLAMSLIGQEQKVITETGRTRTRTSRMAAFKRLPKVDRVAKEIADVLRAAGYMAHADALVARKMHPYDVDFYDAIVKRGKDKAMRKAVASLREGQDVLLSKDVKLAVIKDAQRLLRREVAVQKEALKSAQTAVLKGSELSEQINALPDIDKQVSRIRGGIETAEVAVRTAATKLQRLDTLTREHITPLREAVAAMRITGRGKTRRITNGQEILDRIDILINYLTAVGPSAVNGIAEAKKMLLARDPDTVHRATLVMTVDDIVNKALMGLNAALESEYVSNQPKQSQAAPDAAPVGADVFDARQALIDESGRAEDTVEPGGSDQRGREETTRVYFAGKRVPVRSRLHDELAPLDLDEDQIPAVEAINEGLRKGPGFLLNDEQGFGKTVEMMAGAVQTILNGDGIVPVNEKGRPHRILVLTPVPNNFRKDIEDNKRGVGPLLRKHGIEVVLTENGNQNVDEVGVETLAGEPAGKLPDYATKGYDIMLFDEVHKFATPSTVSPAFAMLWNLMRDKQPGGVQPKVVFSTGTFADKPKDTWPVAFIEGVDMKSWWDKLGVEAVDKTSGGKRKVHIKNPTGRTMEEFVLKVMDRARGIMDRMAQEYKVIRRLLDLPSIEQMSTPVDEAVLNQASDDIAEVLGMASEKFRQLVAKTKRELTLAARDPKFSADQKIYLSEVLKLPVAARQAAEAVHDGRKPIVMVTTVNSTQFGAAGKKAGMPRISPPKLFDELFKKYLEEMNVAPSPQPVAHFWRGQSPRKGYEQAAERFQQGEHQVLFASYAKASTGENLHHGPDTADGQRVLIMPQRSNNYKQQRQAMARVVRRGQVSEPIIRLLFNEKAFDADGFLGGLHERAERLFNTIAAKREPGAPVEEERGLGKVRAVNLMPYLTREIPGVAVDERHIALSSRFDKDEKRTLGNAMLAKTPELQMLTYGDKKPGSAVWLGEDLEFRVLDNKGSTTNIDTFYKHLNTYLEAKGFKVPEGYDPVQGTVPEGPDLENAVAIMTSSRDSLAAMRPVNRRLKKFLETVPGLERAATTEDVLDVIAAGNEPVAWLASALRQLNLQVPIYFDQRDLPVPARYIPNSRSIQVRLGMQGHPQLAHVLLHEIVHAATLHGLRSDPALRQALAPIYEQVLQRAIEQNLLDPEAVATMRAGRTLSRAQRQAMSDIGLYGLTNMEEFISEAFLSPQLQELLTHESEAGRPSFLRQIWNAVLQWLDRVLGTQLADNERVRTLMDELRSEWSNLFQTEAQAEQYWRASRGAYGQSTAIELGETASKMIDGLRIGRQRYVDPHVNLPRMDLSRRRAAEVYYKSRTDLLNEGRAYARDDELIDLFDEFVREKDQQVQDAMKMTKRYEDLIEDWDSEVAAVPSKMHHMHDMMARSTHQGVFLDKEFNDSEHNHLRQFEHTKKDGTVEVVALSPSQVDAARQSFDKLKREWESAEFSENQRKVYTRAYGATRQRWETLTTALIENVLRVYAPQASQSTLDALTQKLRGDHRLPTDWQSISGDGTPMPKQDTKEAKDQRRKLARILAETRARGPYFPLRRNGNLVVSAEKKWAKESFKTKAERKERMKELYAGDRTLKFRSSKEGNQFILEPYEYAVEMFDNTPEAEEFQQRMVEAGFDTKDPQKRKDFSKTKGVLTGTDLDRALADFPTNSKARQAIVGFFLDMYPGTSIQQSLRFRRNVRGADREMSQAFAQYVSASSYHMAQLRHGHRIANALKKLRGYVSRSARGELSFRDPRYTYQMDTIIAELERREKDYQLEDEQKLDFAGKINRFMFLHTLAQPGFLIMNATQVPLTTAPVLAGRFGIGPAQRALSDALSAILPDFMRRLRGTTGSIFTGKPNRAFFEFLEDENGVLSPGREFVSNVQRSNLRHKEDVIRAITELGEMGRLDLTLSGVVLQAQRQTGTTFSRKFNIFMELARGPVQVVETGNRVWTGTAAYILYRNANEKKYREADDLENLHRDAVAYAAQIIDETQVNYSEADAPRWMARSGVFGAFAPVLFMYKRYAHYMQMNFIRNAYRAINTQGLDKEEIQSARRSIRYLVTTHVAAAGALGLPQLAKMMAALAFSMFKDDEDPRNFDEWARGGLQEWFGDLGGEIVAHGLPRLLNVDLSASLGLDNAFLFTDELRNRQGEDWLKEFGYALGGPVLGLAGRLLAVPEFMEKGEYWRAAELAAPKAMRNVMQAWRFSEEGMTDRSGDVIRVARDVDGWELLQRTIGLQSGDIAEFYEGRSAITAARKFFTQRRNALLGRYRSGARGPALMRDIEAYNQSVPAPGLKITPETLKTVRERGTKKEESRFGMAMPRTQIGLESYGAWANF